MKDFARELVKFVILYRAQRRLRKALPVIFENVDETIPELLFDGSAYRAKQAIARAIRSATGEKASGVEIELIDRLYSPIEAARHKLQR